VFLTCRYTCQEDKQVKLTATVLFEEKGELLTNYNQQHYIERLMIEEIFNEIINNTDDDYKIKVKILAIMKPSKW
jgi:hypothetical protein